MKLLMVHNSYKQYGGEDVAVSAEAKLLQEHGHTIELLEADNSEIVGIASKMKAALGTVYSFTSRRRLEARIQSFQPDVVHVHNSFPLHSPSIYYACQNAGIPVVQTLHNYRLICPGALLMRNGRVCKDCVGKLIPWPGVLHGCYRNSQAGTAVVAAMLATHNVWGTWQKAVDAYIALTEFSRRKLIEGGLPSEKISVIPSLAPDLGEPSKRCGDYAFFAGRLSPEKGIATLLTAWDYISNPSLRLKIAGDGPLREEVQRHADGKRIEYLGSLSRAQVQGVMRQASFLILPSNCYENFPLAIVEAFASGLPVIASGMGAMQEIIDNHRTGLHSRPADPEDLAEKIQWMMDHPSDRARMGQAARADYKLKYTPERNYQQLIELYNRTILARHRKGSLLGNPEPSNDAHAPVHSLAKEHLNRSSAPE